MEFSLIDSHAHITSQQIIGDLEGVLVRAKKSGISHIINICTDQKTLDEGLLLAKKENWIFNAGATTPHDVEKEGEKLFPVFKEKALNKELIAVGETGLDYFYYLSSKKLQKKFLIKYFQLALEAKLPLIIHCRDAFSDLYELADSDYQGPAVLHCFTGTMKEAEKGLERGWYISLSGIVTFNKSLELREIAKEVPLENILIETDSPYLAPQSKRGKQNEPSYLVETAKCVAEVKGIKLEELAKITSENAKKIFSIN